MTRTDGQGYPEVLKSLGTVRQTIGPSCQCCSNTLPSTSQHEQNDTAQMAAEGDDDLQLMRASAGLLSNLQVALTKLLWKRGDKRVHHLVRVRDLDHVIQLVCFASLFMVPPRF